MTDEARRGVLGQGSFLLVTSNADRTSPVKRGKWILENVLGTPPPLRLPMFPSARAERRCAAHHAGTDGGASQERALRRLPQLMDPIGLSLENFDAVGRGVPARPAISRRRARYRRLRAVARRHQGQRAHRTAPSFAAPPGRLRADVYRKTMTFALGRGLSAQDMPAVRAIVRQAAARDSRSRRSCSALWTAHPSRCA